MKKQFIVQELNEGGKKGFNLLTGLKAESGNTLFPCHWTYQKWNLFCMSHHTSFSYCIKISREEKQILKLELSNLSAAVMDNEKHLKVLKI